MECVSTHKHSLCDAKKSRGFILFTNCASKSTLAADTQTLQIFILHSILFSVHHTMMLFFTVYANGLHSFTVIIRHFRLHHLHFTYVSFLLVEIPFVWSMHTQHLSWEEAVVLWNTRLHTNKIGIQNSFRCICAFHIKIHVFFLFFGWFVRSIRFLFSVSFEQFTNLRNPNDTKLTASWSIIIHKTAFVYAK